MNQVEISYKPIEPFEIHPLSKTQMNESSKNKLVDLNNYTLTKYSTFQPSYSLVRPIIESRRKPNMERVLAIALKCKKSGSIELHFPVQFLIETEKTFPDSESSSSSVEAKGSDPHLIPTQMMNSFIYCTENKPTYRLYKINDKFTGLLEGFSHCPEELTFEWGDVHVPKDEYERIVKEDFKKINSADKKQTQTVFDQGSSSQKYARHILGALKNPKKKEFYVESFNEMLLRTLCLFIFFGLALVFVFKLRENCENRQAAAILEGRHRRGRFGSRNRRARIPNDPNMSFEMSRNLTSTRIGPRGNVIVGGMGLQRELQNLLAQRRGQQLGQQTEQREEAAGPSIDLEKYDQVVKNRPAGEDYGPWGEKE